MSSQLHPNEHQNRADLPHPQADPSQIYPDADPSQINPQTHHDPTLADGTDVIGEPAVPPHDPPPTATSAAASTHAPSGDPRSVTDYDVPPTSETQPSTSSHTRTPADFSNNPTGNFPTAQPPHSLSTAARQQEASKMPDAPANSSNPYVRTTSATTESTPGKSPIDSIMQVFNKWGKKAEDVTGNVWNHLRTGPNMADTALGRIAVGAKAMSEGGLEKVYRQTFDVAPDEHLLKTYACFLSTSTGPVAGTLYISSLKLAFCSDRPLAMPASSPRADNNNDTTNPPGSTPATTTSPTSKTSPSSQQMYYKVMVPISQVEAVSPSENTQKKPPEKYVQVKTNDGHEFWFMGFVNYDKGVKNLQETLLNMQESLLNKDAHPATDDATHVVE